MISPALLARIAHQTPQRTRLVVHSGASEAALQACAARLNASGRVTVETRPRSASLVLTHDDAWPDIAALLPEAGLRLTAPPTRDPIGKTNAALAHLNRSVATASGGRMDLTNAAFLTFVALGFVQLARGQIAGPALTLFNQAMTLALLHTSMLNR